VIANTRRLEIGRLEPRQFDVAWIAALKAILCDNHHLRRSLFMRVAFR
jgi:hypothetical protein